MEPMTSVERIGRILKRQPVDRIGLFEHFWSDTHKEYVSAGHIKENESFEDHFGLDMQNCGAFNLKANIDWVDETLEETEETLLIKDGNGAVLRRHKLHDSTPEHVDFEVKTREEWEKYKPMLLKVDERRIDFQGYRINKESARKNNRFFNLSGANVFECIHPICGHENMLIGMALDPEWIEDMVKTYIDLIISLQEILFSKEGFPDGIWYYEDMGYKNSPFMSPSMYKEMIMPAHKKSIDFAHSHGMPVTMHSCGFVEPLLPHMVQAGIDCLQVIEIKAGMDLLRIHKNFGDSISLMGGIDVRTLYSNDKDIIDKELESKIPFVKQGYGFCLHSDHSIPKTVDYNSYKYFIQRGLELGKY